MTGTGGGVKYRRCCSMRCNEPSAAEVLRSFAESVEISNEQQDFGKKELASVLDLFRSSISREWECFVCDCWTGKDGYKDSFTETHGVGYVCHGIVDFCGWYIVRKCQVSDEYEQVCYAVMEKLASFLLSHGYMDKEEEERVLECLEYCRSLQDDITVADALRNLQEISRQRQSMDDDDDSIPWSHMSSESGFISVEKVTSDGWILKSPKRHLLLRLPPEIARLGEEGMELSCVEIDNHSASSYLAYNEI